MSAGAATREEIASQPACWRRAARIPAGALPPAGARVAAVGCGTSLHIAQSYADLLDEVRTHPTEAEQGPEAVLERLEAIAQGLFAASPGAALAAREALA